MKKILFILSLAVLFFTGNPLAIDAQMMGGDPTLQDNHTAREEVEGKEVWEKLQSKKVACQNLSDEDFEHLGEYFMGQMMGDAHSAMNEMIMRMHGEEGENQIHVAMGKRLSGCDPNAIISAQEQGWMPMMQMMWGGWSTPFNTNQLNNHMMYGLNNGMGGGFSIFGGFFMIFWWVMIVVAVVALVKWIMHQSGTRNFQGKSALDILKERYARGEIDKKEFEEKRKDLS